jgi:hypothetical protein
MEKVDVNKTITLSEHYTLGELTKTSTGMMNIPSRVSIENMKRVCGWLEALRCRYNQRYVLGGSSSSPKLGEDRRGLNERQVSPSSDHPAHPGTPPNLGGEKDTEEPIIISSGYRSPEVNRKVGGSATSNHLTGCAVDIRVYGIEQALRYAVILMDYADETRQDYDELLIERNRSGRYWVHFAVRPPKSQNRRKTAMLSV